MAQVGIPDLDPTPPSSPNINTFFSRFMKRGQIGSNTPQDVPLDTESEPEAPSRPGMLRRMSKKVIPGLPRAQTFKRQLSEQREHLAPIAPSTDERRAISMDRRSRSHLASRKGKGSGNPRSSMSILSHDEPPPVPLIPKHYAASSVSGDFVGHSSDCAMTDDENAQSTDGEQSECDDNDIAGELETIWILNLSMHYRDRSRREKFFVTYRQDEHRSRRVTVSLDYRDAPEGSLEQELDALGFQKDKSRKIYEAIRSSLGEIQFLDTVTNLKLETTDGRLHVHVVEDGNEVINYPYVSQLAHLDCRRVRENEINFDSHLSGFVYRVSVTGRQGKKDLIKKEIPSPEVIEEFLYEIHALQSLAGSNHVIHFYGIVVDNSGQEVRGLLIDYAPRGALIDVIFDSLEDNDPIEWQTKQHWAKQIVYGLAEIHEAGFVQGDFTLSNIVIDDNDDAKIIDINRRGCPVGWEPPELSPLIESGIRISMYIGVKSDLFQLGMVLYGLATDQEEPEKIKRPLTLEHAQHVPEWYRKITEICLSHSPQGRLPAAELLRMFPPDSQFSDSHSSYEYDEASISVEDRHSVRHYEVAGQQGDGYPRSYATNQETPPHNPDEVYVRGRSPTRDWRWNLRRGASGEEVDCNGTWANGEDIPPSYSDVGDDDDEPTLQPSSRVPNLDVTPTQTLKPDSDLACGEVPAELNLEDDDSTPVAEIEDRPLEAAVNSQAQGVLGDQNTSGDKLQQVDDHLGTVPSVKPTAAGAHMSILIRDADSASINTTASADTGVTNSDTSTRLSDTTESSVEIEQQAPKEGHRATSTDHEHEEGSVINPNDVKGHSIDHVGPLPNTGQQALPTIEHESKPGRTTEGVQSAATDEEATNTSTAMTAPAHADQKAVAAPAETTTRSHAERPTETEEQAPKPPTVEADVVNNTVNDLPDTFSGRVEPHVDGTTLEDDAPFYDAVTAVQTTESPRAAKEHGDGSMTMHKDPATRHLSPDGLPVTNALMTETTA